MKIDGTPYRSIWLAEDGWSLRIIDQTKLPHAFETLVLKSADDAAQAIKAMIVRGVAPSDLDYTLELVMSSGQAAKGRQAALIASI